MIISGEQFATELAGIKVSAFRVEAHPSPALDVERHDFERFLAGAPTPPEDMAWYRPWVDQVREWDRQGITLTRVRVLADPPTGYQRWLLWGGPFFSSIGERIRYMDAKMAHHIGLPLEDWWLLDDERVITITFTPEGGISGYELTTDPDQAEIYRQYRDLALENATAETIAV